MASIRFSRTPGTGKTQIDIRDIVNAAARLWARRESERTARHGPESATLLLVSIACPYCGQYFAHVDHQNAKLMVYNHMLANHHDSHMYGTVHD